MEIYSVGVDFFQISGIMYLYQGGIMNSVEQFCKDNINWREQLTKKNIKIVEEGDF